MIIQTTLGKSLLKRGAAKGYLVRCGLLLCGILLGHVSTVSAEADQASGSKRLEEITVTARRIEENLQDVPVAITALGQDAIDKQIVVDAKDLQRFVPSLAVDTSFSNEVVQFRIRGIGNEESGNPGILSYIAERPLSTVAARSGVYTGMYYDLQSVQVLNGPQGTLFGRNALGGAVLIEPKRPTNEFEGFVMVGAGDYGKLGTQAAVNVPIIEDKLLARFALHVQDRDGLVEDVVTGQEYDKQDFEGYRLGLTFSPTDNFENYLLLDYHEVDTGGTGMKNVEIAGLMPLLFPDAATYLPTPFQSDKSKTSLNGDIHQITKIYMATDIAEWHLSPTLSVKNIISYREIKRYVGIDYDGTPFPLVATFDKYTYDKDFTEEIKLTGTAFDERLDWTVGVFYLKAQPKEVPGTQITQLFGVGPGSDCPPATAAFGLCFEADQATQEGYIEESKAVYGQGTYALTPRLRLTTGLRYTRDEAESFIARKRLVDGSCSFADAMQPDCLAGGSDEFKKLTYNVDMAYDITPDVMVYAGIRQGFRSGGFNLSAGSQEDFSYDTEELLSHEIGMRADWQLGDVQIRTNIDAFLGKYKDVQVSDFSVGRIGSTAIRNSGDGEIHGVELKTTIIPNRYMEFSGFYGLNDGELDRPDISQPDAPLKGSPFINMPEKKAGLIATFFLPVDERYGEISLEGSYTYQSEHFAFGDDGPGTERRFPQVEFFNARIDWRNVMGHPVDVAVYGTNLKNDRPVAGELFIAGLEFLAETYHPPRMWGVQVRYQF